ncbi:hypothetical protein DFH07DRAFT_745130, partial [Mycena maculata]
LASGSEDNTVHLWDAESRAMLSDMLEGHTSEITSVAFSPDGKHIVSGSTVCLCEGLYDSPKSNLAVVDMVDRTRQPRGTNSCLASQTSTRLMARAQQTCRLPVFESSHSLRLIHPPGDILNNRNTSSDCNLAIPQTSIPTGLRLHHLYETDSASPRLNGCTWYD